MYYDLWDMRSRNQLETFETEQEALAAVRAYLAADLRYADSLSLGYEDEQGGEGIIAEGPALALRARAAARETKAAAP